MAFSGQVSLKQCCASSIFTICFCDTLHDKWVSVEDNQFKTTICGGPAISYSLKLQALGKLIFYRHIAHVAQKVEKLCF